MPPPNRRRRRSRFRRKALRYLLEYRAQKYKLTLLAVSDGLGRLLGASANRPDPAEVAAVAPILDPLGRGSPVTMFGKQVWVLKTATAAQEYYLCAMGDRQRAMACTQDTCSAVRRILG